MMAEKGEVLTICFEEEEDRAGEAMDPPLTKMQCLEPVEEKEEEPHLKASVIAKGEDYGRLFELLEEVQGPLEVQIQFVEFAIKEAIRFKRRHLIQFLEKKREEMLFQLFLQQ